jgi:glutamate synthase domain-containing protein 2
MAISRFFVLQSSVLCSLLLVALAAAGMVQWPWALGPIVLVLIGLYDLQQTHHSIQRNYPIIGHLRFMLEFIGPEIRQYFIESDTEAAPFSRQQRAIVYQRSKNVLDKRPFGTHFDPYAVGFEWINHSIAPAKVAEPTDFRVRIGGDRAQPYDASVFNISAMSFGALSGNAIQSLNRGAKLGGFAHDTGEGSISVHHREHGGDLIWEIGSGYFGCRTADGRFDPERFAEQATHPQVRMIEVKLSQGAKPGHGGVLPGPKVTAEIAEARGVPIWTDCISPASHREFSTPIQLLEFIARLRELSGDKPTGFKLAIGHPWEWFSIAKAMQETGITPDFIVVDGKEGGTGAAPVEFMDHVGMPMRDGLRLVHNTLLGLDLRGRVRIGAAGRMITAFDIAGTMALGADWCNAARGFMFAVGCIQAQHCHTGACPTGVATQDPVRQRALVVTDKAQRVYNFHHNTVEALAELVAAAGLDHPGRLRAHHIMRRISPTEISSLADLYPTMPHGALLAGDPPIEVFRRYWAAARADRFS